MSRSSWLGMSTGAGVLLILWAISGTARKTAAGAWTFAAAGFVLPLIVLGWIALAPAPAAALRGTSEAERLADLQRQLAIECARLWDPMICQTVPAADLQRERERRAALHVAPGAAMPTAASEHGDTTGSLANARGLEDRAAIIRLAWREYTSSWVTMTFGIGLGTFLRTSAATLSYPLIIHNTPIWVLVELGPLGIAAFTWLIWRTVMNLWTARRVPALGPLSHGLLAALSAWLVFSLFNEASYFRHFWLVLVAADRLYLLTRYE
jgi:hypothetical protein